MINEWQLSLLSSISESRDLHWLIQAVLNRPDGEVTDRDIFFLKKELFKEVNKELKKANITVIFSIGGAIVSAEGSKIGSYTVDYTKITIKIGKKTAKFMFSIKAPKLIAKFIKSNQDKV